MWGALVCLGLAWLGLRGHLLVGGLIMAGGFAAAAVLRAVLPPEGAGGLHVRARRTDIVVNATFAAAVTLATLLVHLREGT